MMCQDVALFCRKPSKMISDIAKFPVEVKEGVAILCRNLGETRHDGRRKDTPSSAWLEASGESESTDAEEIPDIDKLIAIERTKKTNLDKRASEINKENIKNQKRHPLVLQGEISEEQPRKIPWTPSVLDLDVDIFGLTQHDFFGTPQQASTTQRNNSKQATPKATSESSGQQEATPRATLEQSGQKDATPNATLKPSGQQKATATATPKPSGQEKATPKAMLKRSGQDIGLDLVTLRTPESSKPQSVFFNGKDVSPPKSWGEEPIFDFKPAVGAARIPEQAPLGNRAVDNTDLLLAEARLCSAVPPPAGRYKEPALEAARKALDGLPQSWIGGLPKSPRVGSSGKSGIVRSASKDSVQTDKSKKLTRAASRDSVQTDKSKETGRAQSKDSVQTDNPKKRGRTASKDSVQAEQTRSASKGSPKPNGRGKGVGASPPPTLPPAREQTPRRTRSKLEAISTEKGPPKRKSVSDVAQQGAATEPKFDVGIYSKTDKGRGAKKGKRGKKGKKAKRAMKAMRSTKALSVKRGRDESWYDEALLHAYKVQAKGEKARVYLMGTTPGKETAMLVRNMGKYGKLGKGNCKILAVVKPCAISKTFSLFLSQIRIM